MPNESSKSNKPLQPEAGSRGQASRKRLLSVLAAATPLLLAVIIAFIYWLTSSVFIKCKWGLAGCRQLTVVSAYLDNKNTLHKYPIDKLQPLSEIEPQLQDKLREKREVDEALGKLILQSDGLAKQLADSTKLSTEESSRLTTTKKNLDSLVLALTPRQTKLDEQVKALQTQLSSIHNRQSKIYWSRVMYATFVALFVMVSLACLAIAAFIILRVVSSRSPAVRGAALFAAMLVSAGVGVWLYVNSAEHFMVINEIANFIKAEDAENIHALTNVLNSFGYAVTTALVLAVTALLWFPTKIVAPQEADFESNCNWLADRMKYLRMILYVGTAMLLIAIFRMKAGLDWALASLVQSDVTSAETFNKTLITSQGSFFTLLLAAVYIPAAYIILKAANSLSTSDETKKSETLNNKGLAMTAPSFKEYLPRLTVMLLPFLVGPIAELAKHVFA